MDKGYPNSITMRPLLFLFIFSLLINVASANYLYLEQDHDHFWLANDNVSYRYSLEGVLLDTIDHPGNPTISYASMLPDGGMYLTDDGATAIRYTYAGDDSIYDFGATYNPTIYQFKGEHINRVNQQYIPYGALSFYSYANQQNAGYEQNPITIGDYDDIFFSGVSGVFEIRDVDYNRRYDDRVFVLSEISTPRLSTATSLFDRHSLVSVGGNEPVFAMESHRSLSVDDPSQLYLRPQSSQHLYRAYDQEALIDGTFTALYTVNYPADFETTGMIVWRAKNNHVVSYGWTDSDGTDVPGIVIYDRDGSTASGGFSTSEFAGDARFVDAVERPDGKLLLLEWRSGSNARLHIIPVTGSRTVVDLDHPVETNTKIGYDDPLSHYRQGNKLGMEHFDAIPSDVYSYILDPTFSDVPEYLDYTFIDVPTRTVHLTISDIVLDNLPVEMLVAHPTDYVDPRFSATHLDRTVLKQYNTSLLNSIDSDTIPDPTPNSSDYDIVEYEFVFALDRLASQNNVSAWIEFVNPENIWIAGDDNVSERIAVQRWYGSPTDAYSHYTNNVYTHRDFNDGVAHLDNATILARDVNSGGSIDEITVRYVLDRTAFPHKAFVRTEVSRSGVADSKASSVWFASVVMSNDSGSDAYNGDVDDIIIRLVDSDVSAQVSFTSYGYDEPTFTTGFDTDVANNARMSQAFVLEGGEQILRTYYTNNRDTTSETTRDHLGNYVDWTYTITLDNASILGIDDSPFDPSDDGTTPTGSGVAGTTGKYPIPNIPGFSQAQSFFVYSFVVLIAIWLIIVGYAIFISNTTGDTWVQSLGVGVASITSILWIITASFIGWLPVWVIVLMIVMGAGVVTMMFRRTFLGTGD